MVMKKFVTPILLLTGAILYSSYGLILMKVYDLEVSLVFIVFPAIFIFLFFIFPLYVFLTNQEFFTRIFAIFGLIFFSFSVYLGAGVYQSDKDYFSPERREEFYIGGNVNNGGDRNEYRKKDTDRIIQSMYLIPVGIAYLLVNPG